MSANKALEIAKSMSMDLVCVSASSNPPVCKVMDHGRFLYDQKKKLKEQKMKEKISAATGTKMKEKEFRFKGLIENHDLEIRAQKANSALKKGHRVLISVVTNRKHLKKDPNCGERVIQAVMDLTKEFRQEIGEKKAPNPMMRQFVLNPKII
eukprot:CAMPEP_0117758164 /NCGR_PEP_ID=MMETSP0947-20121206/15205_1 /TAXON_ID=44440 /ORGANISM="Chattonella subsalsa, Strain CCMP2191" /LENGTH=151 /DNA_ID=CAMNT_0005578279 /DNA_START=364 /DNA_END=819 /DNA_ORIENTATION=-